MTTRVDDQRKEQTVSTATLERYRHPPIIESAADRILERILREISVPADVLAEAKKRRDLVLEIGLWHDAALRAYESGSIAHGTHNSPLGDADCGIVIDRRVPEFRNYGPEAGRDAVGPEPFYQRFAAFIGPELRAAGYPQLELDLEGNRAIKFIFNAPIDLDELGVVDPDVELIVALRRDDEDLGIWIPNRRKRWWDPANPQKHTLLMTERDPKPLSVHRAHEVRLGKRAIKRDAATPGRAAAMCSWNLSALSLDLVEERKPLALGFAELLVGASTSIATGLTDDPARVAGPIQLPNGLTQEVSAARLGEMASVVKQALTARSEQGAWQALRPLFATEIDVIRTRERQGLSRSTLYGALGASDAAATTRELGSHQLLKPTASDGD
jgi:hypothetical protein